MPIRRFQHQKSTLDESQVSLSRQEKTRRSARWWTAGLLTVTSIVGGVIGYFSFPGDSAARFGGLFAGSFLFSLLGFWLKAVIVTLRNKRISNRSLFGWGASLLAAAVFGEILGYILLPSMLPGPSRILLGVIIGIVVTTLLIRQVQEFAANPAGSLVEGLGEGCLGCLFQLLVLFILLVGTVSSLLIGHT